MSVRGLKFLDNWVAEQLPVVARGDPIGASDLADQLMTAAEKAGIGVDEINSEVESVFEVMRRRAAATHRFDRLFAFSHSVFPLRDRFGACTALTRRRENRILLGWGDSQKRPLCASSQPLKSAT